MADPPKGLKLIPNETITHPVFGEMKVISHKEDIDFYHQKVKDPNKGPYENEYDEGLLAENFIKYVLNADSLKQANIPQKDMVKFVDECCYSQAGMAALKVITANYMREYDRIKKFCEEHEKELKACYDFSQTKEGEELYEKEKQIFELEEKLKELFDLKTDPHKHSKIKVEISREDLLNLSEYCKNQQDKDSFEGPLPLSNEIINSFEQRECNIRKDFCQKYEDELRKLSDLWKNAELQSKDLDSDNRKSIELGKKLEKMYTEETEKVNEAKFSCIRRSVMPACYFPILYRHFFVKDNSKHSHIGDVNKFLYRALKLENDDEFCVFVSETLSIGLTTEDKEFKNHHINSRHELSDFKRDRYGSLLHELMHFMNTIDSFDGQEKSTNIYLRNSETNIIKNTGVISELQFLNEEIDGEKLDEVRDKLEEALRNLYDTGSETWTMYGIFICQDKKNPEKYEFYYDPINEAVADVECKIINGKEMRVVRTGHRQFVGTEEEYIDPDDETSSLTIEVLNKKVGIYQFYFDKGEKLRKLIDK